MIGTQVTGSKDFNDTLLLEPGQAETSLQQTANLMRLEDVVADSGRRRAEKRRLLVSWASDVRAMPNTPGPHQMDNGAVVGIGDILRALKSPDDSRGSGHSRWNPHRSPSGLRIRFPSRLKSALSRGRSDSDDDDDDPPPCPAMIFNPFGGSPSSSAAADLVLAA